MSELKKTIGPWGLVAIGAAGVIGSSYLYLASPLFDNFTLGGVVVGMVLATLLASCVTIGIGELAAMFPRAGGEFVYSYISFGRFPAFLVGWLLLATYTGIVGFYITATGRLISTFVGGLEVIPLYDIGGGVMYLPILLIGLLLVGGTVVVNWFGTELSFRLQLILFIVLIAIGLLIVGVGFGAGSYENAQPAFGDLSSVEGGASAIAFVIPALGFLTGFSVVAVLSEEADVKPKQLGKLIVLSVLIAGFFYAIIFYATGWIIPWRQTAELDNGTVEAFNVAGFPMLSALAFVAGVIGIVTTVIAVFASASRLAFSLARVGLLPPVFGRLDEKSGVPRNSILLTAAMGLIVGLIGPDAIQWILNVGGFFVAAIWVLTVLAFYSVRRNYPKARRPYRVRYSFLPALGGVGGLILVVLTLASMSPLAFESPFEYGLVVVFLALGVGLYWLAPKNQSKEQNLRGMLGEYTKQLE